jgi:hypothetical protein
MKAFIVDGVLFSADQMVDGILVDPKLPANFDDTDNALRPAEQMVWWRRPYVVSYRDTTRAFREVYPSGVRFDVRCLDGGGWDRSTWWGSFPTVEEAVRCAKGTSPYPGLGNEWPGRSASPAGSTGPN